MSIKKQSIITGGLISSAGIFVSKLIGIIYVIPFNAILETAANQTYYGVAYQIYSYILNVSIAGFPFAIATLIAKYSSRDDYKTSLLVKKLSTAVMVVLGFVSMLFLILFAKPLASLMIAQNASESEIMIMRNVLIIISFALFFVPILSGIRGFYQGLKEMEVYALSQVLEQISRVIFLLGASALAIYVFGQQRIWAVYFGVLSTSISAILAIIHIKLYDRKKMKDLHRLAKKQEIAHNNNVKVILQELVLIAFPYLLVAILGYSDSMINLMFLPKGLAAHGDVLQSDAIVGAITLGVNKLMSIPMILAPGFSAAIIPYITTAIAQKNRKLIQKNMRDCVDSVLYIGIPISFCLFAFAKPIYYVLYNPKENLQLCSEILSWYSIEAFIGTIAPIFTALMMAAGLRKENIQNQVISVAIKVMLTYPMIAWFGYPGAVISSFISMGMFVVLDAYIIWKHHDIEWGYTLRKVVFMLIGTLGIAVVAWIMQVIGWKGYDVGRIQAMVELAIGGILAIATYIGITYFFQLPQTIFHMDASQILGKLRKAK